MTLQPNDGPPETQVTVTGTYPFKDVTKPYTIPLWFVNQKTNRYEQVGSITIAHCPCAYRTQVKVPNDAPLGKTQFALAAASMGVANADFTVTFGSMKLQPAFGPPGTLFTASGIIMGEGSDGATPFTDPFRFDLIYSDNPSNGGGKIGSLTFAHCGPCTYSVQARIPANASQGAHSISFGAGWLQAASASFTVTPGFPLPGGLPPFVPGQPPGGFPPFGPGGFPPFGFHF
jgi:hypothetical protein